MRMGTGDFVYEPVEDWAKLPPGWSFKEIGAVGVDKNDNVYVFNRGEHPMMVFDRDGTFLRAWGEGVFPRAHGLQMGPDDTVWLTDDGDHSVRQCTLDGQVLMTLGTPGKPSAFMSGEPFHRCTHTALSPKGEIYVSDGYGNARVHKYAPNGKLLLSWGSSGTDPGEFNIVHNIACDADGWVYVADRENHRVQVFDGNGKYETQWNNLHRPCGLYMPSGSCPICYIGELGPGMAVNRHAPNLGPRVTIVDNTGKRIGRIGALHAGLGPDEFTAPHGIAVDSRGDIYVGEVTWTNWPTMFPDQPRPDSPRCLHKFRKVS
jgi:DNA-binding beta-propeller fold protein YncE